MQPQHRLKKNSQFRYVYRKGKGGACRELSVGYIKGGRLLVGFSVSKKIGNAVQRNRARRVIRAALQQLLRENNLSGWDFVFVARTKTTRVKSGVVQAAMKDALHTLEVIA